MRWTRRSRWMCVWGFSTVLLLASACASDHSVGSATGTTTPGSAIARRFPIVDLDAVGAELFSVDFFGTMPGGVVDNCSGLFDDDVTRMAPHIGKDRVDYDLRNGSTEVTFSFLPDGTTRFQGGQSVDGSKPIEQGLVERAVQRVTEEDWKAWARRARFRQHLIGCQRGTKIGWDAYSPNNSAIAALSVYLLDGGGAIHGLNVDDAPTLFPCFGDKSRCVVEFHQDTNPLALDVQRPGVTGLLVESLVIGDPNLNMGARTVDVFRLDNAPADVSVKVERSDALGPSVVVVR